MKSLLNLRLATATLIVALFAGCAGITEANLDDMESTDTASVGQTVQSVDSPGYFDSGDQEDVIDVRPDKKTENRE